MTISDELEEKIIKSLLNKVTHKTIMSIYGISGHTIQQVRASNWRIFENRPKEIVSVSPYQAKFDEPVAQGKMYKEYKKTA